MADVAVQSSQTAGACGEPPTSFQTPSQSVLRVNGQLVVCVGDSIIPHPHSGEVTSGSSCMYVDGNPVAHVGSNISCGDVIATGDSTLQVS